MKIEVCGFVGIANNKNCFHGYFVHLSGKKNLQINSQLQKPKVVDTSQLGGFNEQY